MGKLIKKVTHCSKYGTKSDYIQVSLFPRLDEVFYKRRGRLRKKKRANETRKEQKALNRKIAKRKFRAKLEANFGKGDYALVLTYAERPESLEEAHKKVKAFLQRLRRAYKKIDAGAPKYMLVTEVGKRGGIHHHMVMDHALGRDAIEELWRYGFCNTKRLHPDEDGLGKIAGYMTKRLTEEDLDDNEKGKKHWSCSKGLIEPWVSYSDKMSNKREKVLEEAPEDSEAVKEVFEKAHKGYTLLNFERTYCEITDQWYYFAEMMKKQETKPKPKPRKSDKVLYGESLMQEYNQHPERFN